jgi:hypothetical protein
MWKVDVLERQAARELMKRIWNVNKPNKTQLIQIQMNAELWWSIRYSI